jgi:hypothetical protein
MDGNLNEGNLLNKLPFLCAVRTLTNAQARRLCHQNLEPPSQKVTT